MSRYETYKPSGIDWIGEVPEHWERKKIGRCFQTIGSGTTPEAGNSDYYEEGTINWINTGDLNDGDIIECEKQITKEALDKHSVLKIYPKGTVLIALYGATIGKTGILQIEGATNQACCALADSPFIIPKFTFYWTNAVKDFLLTQSYGGGQPNISQEIIRQLRIYLPSKSEQLAIANYLDDQTQKIDRLIANKKAQAEKLKELRQIEINNAVTKGLNPNVEMKDSGIEWLGKIPKHWEVKRLKNLAIQMSEKSSEILDDDFLVALENIGSHTGKFIETSSEYENNGIKFKKDNLLYNKLRPYLNKVFLADKDGICVGDIIVIECTPKLHPAFLQFRMLSDSFCSIIMSSVYGAKMPRTSWQFISSLKIGYPSLEEQTEIASYLHQRTSAIDQLIKNIEAQIEKLQELRKIKIYEAVTGKIKVNAYAETTA
jgi:restriction endonuclease S subunit